MKIRLLVADKVRITQNASCHAGDAGEVASIDGPLIAVKIDGYGCLHVFDYTEVEGSVRQWDAAADAAGI